MWTLPPMRCMPRSLRVEVAGGIHHVYSRGAVKQTIFIDDDDRRRYIARLAKVVEWTSWRLLAYCLMGNHMHLLVETPRPNLGQGMHLVHGPFALAFNNRHEKAGHVFGARFDSKLVESDLQLWVLTRYIVQNPVEAGICRSPEDWPWGSHAHVASGRSPSWLATGRLCSFFGSMGGDPRDRYFEFVSPVLPRP
jgi:REP-associated tyrosine transposase